MNPLYLILGVALCATILTSVARSLAPAQFAAVPANDTQVAATSDDRRACDALAGRAPSVIAEPAADSKPDSLTIATATITPALEPEKTCQLMRDVIARTLDEKPNVRLFLFGETVLGWFSHPEGSEAYHRSIAEAIPGPSSDMLAGLARDKSVYICFGMTEQDGENIYNSQVLISPEGKILAVHRKSMVVNAFFSAGERKLTVVDIDGAKAAVLVCADVRNRELLRGIRRERLDVVLAGLTDGATDTRLSQMIGTLFDAWAFTANRFGEEGKMKWHGMTSITDPWGRLVQSSVHSECVLVQEVPLDRPNPTARSIRRTLVFFKGIGLAVWMMLRVAWKGLVG